MTESHGPSAQPLTRQIARQLAQIDRDFDRHVCEVQRFIRQPSVSADDWGIQEMALLLADKIRSLGAECSIVETGRHPIVYGRLDTGADKTIVFYELYDVQPARESGWIVPPFDAEVVDLPGHGPSIVGRGAANSKGCVVGFLNTLEAIQRSGHKVPVNVIFVVEGEEEIGSPSLPGFIREHAAELKSAECFYQPYFGENASGTTIVYLGIKGMACLELTCEGGDWGGPRERDVHAMHSAWIGSPAWRLVQALATMKRMKDASEVTVIPDFARSVRTPTPEEVGLLSELEESFDEAVVLREQGGAKCFKWAGLSGVELLKKYLYEPSLNLNGIASGYSSAGTILPRQARARLDIRLVPDMEPNQVVDAVRKHLCDQGYPDIKVDVLQAYPPSQSSLDQRPVDALVRSVRELAPGPVQVWPRSAGVAPHYLFTKELGVPMACGGLGHGSKSHSANEYITVEGLRRHERGTCGFLYAL